MLKSPYTTNVSNVQIFWIKKDSKKNLKFNEMGNTMATKCNDIGLKTLPQIYFTIDI